MISGPTASGKTDFSLTLAEKFNGEIINTDSMQIYDGLPLLTAKPSESERLRIPHHLLGVIPPSISYSVSDWLDQATIIFNDIRQRGRLPIFVGGTGLYYKALLDGIADIPDIPPEIRESIRNDSVESSHKRLVELDPAGASSLDSRDTHRISRALEVIVATGKPLSFFHEHSTTVSLLGDMTTEKYLIMPDRATLHVRIDDRCEKMVSSGVIDELRDFLKLGLSPSCPLMKAIGVESLGSFISGDLPQDSAIANFKVQTRRYAKRQCTWFNNQLSPDWKRLERV